MLGSTSLINNYPNIFGVQSGQPLAQLAQTLTTNAKQGASADTVTISSSAAMLQQFLHTEMQGGEISADDGDSDMMELVQLKQHGEMLASMLQLKMKNFEASLTANVQGAGLPMQDMHLKNGDDEGLSLLGDMPNKEQIQNVLGGLQGQFTDIARLAEVLNMLQQMGPNTVMDGLSSAAAHYAQQSALDKSSTPRSANNFILHVLQSGTSFSFE